MKRSITTEEYTHLATIYSNALDYPFVLTRQEKIIENNLWLVVKNLYPYTMFDGKKVLEHLLIIPKRNEIYQFWDLKAQELKGLKHIEDYICSEFAMFKNNPELSIIKYQKVTGKSLNKLHIHLLVITNR